MFTPNKGGKPVRESFPNLSAIYPKLVIYIVTAIILVAVVSARSFVSIDADPDLKFGPVCSRLSVPPCGTRRAGCWLGGQGHATARARAPSVCAGRPNLLRADRLRAAPGGGGVAGAQDAGRLSLRGFGYSAIRCGNAPQAVVACCAVVLLGRCRAHNRAGRMEGGLRQFRA
eukprot:6982730-Prymnesium_polylepis.1